MADISIDFAGVERCALLLGRLDGDAAGSRAYVLKWADLSFWREGAFWHLYQPHQVAFDRVTGSLSTAEALAGALQASVRQVAQLWRNADHAAQQAMDVAVPWHATIETVPMAVHAERPWLDDDHGTFADVAEAQSHVVAPVVPDTRNQWQYNVLHDALSPVDTVRWAIQQLTGVDILAQILTGVTGDWDAYLRCSIVWHNIDLASTDMASNLYRAASDVPLVWRGHLPASLEWALVAYARAFDHLAQECRYYATAYQQASEAARQFFEGVSPLVELGIDAAILAMVAEEAGMALIETGVGLLLGSAVAAFYVFRAIELFQEVLDQLDKFTSTIQLMGAAQTAYQSHQTWEMPELIDGPRFKVVTRD